MANQAKKSSKEIEARINELGQQIIDQSNIITSLIQQRDEAYKAGPLSEDALNVVELGRRIEDAQLQLIEFHTELTNLASEKLGAYSTEYHEVLAGKQKEIADLQNDLLEAYSIIEEKDVLKQMHEARKTIKQLQSDYNTLAGTLDEYEKEIASKQDEIDHEKELTQFVIQQRGKVEKERDEATKKADLYRTWWKEEEALNEKPFRILQAVFTILDAFDDRIHSNDDYEYYTCIDAVADDVRSTLITCESLVKGFGAEEKVKLSHKEEITEEDETDE